MGIFNQQNEGPVRDRVFAKPTPQLNAENVAILFKEIVDYAQSLEQRIAVLEKKNCQCCDDDMR